MTKTNLKRSSSAGQILDRLTGDSPRLRAKIEKHKLNAKVAEDILAARERAGLTQAQLAKLVRTTQSVISRLENADYGGHSLNMLQRIATALNHQLQVSLIPAKSAAGGDRAKSRRA